MGCPKDRVGRERMPGACFHTLEGMVSVRGYHECYGSADSPLHGSFALGRPDVDSLPRGNSPLMGPVCYRRDIERRSRRRPLDRQD